MSCATGDDRWPHQRHAEIDLASGILDDGPRATGGRSTVGGRAVPISVQGGPDDTLAAYSDGRRWL